jgi:hypothetical protein
MTKRLAGGMLLALAMLAAGGSTVEGQSYASFRAFEIQSFPATRGPWFEAATYCTLKEGGRLCRASEWAVACMSGRFKPGGSPEWVDQLTPEDSSSGPQPSLGPQQRSSTTGSSREGLRALAMVDCERGAWFPIRETLPMRCCRSRIESPATR